MEQRLAKVKQFPRAMQSYVWMLYEFVREYRPAKMLELGVQRGQSTKTIVLAMKMNNFGLLVSIDHKSRHTLLDDEYADCKKHWKFI